MVRSDRGRWAVAARWARVGLVSLGLSGVGLAGCTEQRDLGTRCILIRRGAEGGSSRQDILNRELTNPSEEFVSFGVTDCEDLVCVRDADFEPQNTAPDAPAEGYCSAPCTPQTSSGPLATDPCATGRSEIDDDPAQRFTCRQMLMDEETLAAIKAEDEATYRRYFGGTETPYFCARGDGRPGAAPGTP